MGISPLSANQRAFIPAFPDDPDRSPVGSTLVAKLMPRQASEGCDFAPGRTSPCAESHWRYDCCRPGRQSSTEMFPGA